MVQMLINICFEWHTLEGVKSFFCNWKLTWFYSDVGCCCYSFCCINWCIFADDTAYSSCEYSQLSVNRGHLRKMDISLRRTLGVGPCRFSVILQWREQCSSSLPGGPLQRFLKVSWEVRQYKWLRFWFLSTTTKPFNIIRQPIQSTYQGHSTTVFSHKYVESEENLRESIEKLQKRYENETDT